MNDQDIIQTLKQQIDALKKYIDTRIEEHLHTGRSNDSKQIDYNNLRNKP